LCARAYADSQDVRAFAPTGAAGEWVEYLATLVGGTGCGTFMPGASFIVAGDAPGELDAAVLTTNLGCGTAHVAQLVVDPGARGRGLGRQLVDAVVSHARDRGHARVTLLVAESNRPAGRLYDAAGFVDRARHIVAVRMRARN
jgi:ribosomal protein S18 acetylase RimI-like enzyme